MKKLVFLVLGLAFTMNAYAYIGFLTRTEYISGGVICHYQLSNGQDYAVLLEGTYSCPMTM